MTFEELDGILSQAPYAPFMISLSESGDNELTIRLAPSFAGDIGYSAAEEPNSQLRKILSDARPLLPDKKCGYEIVFDRYIIYQIRNESFFSGNSEDKFFGRFLRIYQKSFLLDNLSRMTDAQMLEDGRFYPAKWTHYGILTLNHIIDIISFSDPIVNF